jgi:hypothetical protein
MAIPVLGDGGVAKKTGTAKPKTRDSHTEKPGSPSPQNPSINPLKNPTGVDGEADERATALPTGALARPPEREKTEAKKDIREKNGGAAPTVPTQLNPHADQQRCEREIADVIGWERYGSLPENIAAEVRNDWSKGKIGPGELLAKFPNGAPVAAVTPAKGIGDGTDPAELIRAARSKKATECSRPELEALHAERRAQQTGAQPENP